MDKAKPFCISKIEVWEAYKRVKVNQGGAGVDEQSIASYEGELTNNLYKLWNRLLIYSSPSLIGLNLFTGQAASGMKVA